VKSPNDSFDLVEIFYAQGASRKAAIDNASHIIYSFNQTDSTLKLNRYFNMGKDEKWRAQKVQLLLRMPVGARVYFDESLRNLIHDVDNIRNIYDNDMINRTWEMTEKGLACVDCDGSESVVGGRMDFDGDIDAHVKIDESGVHIRNEDGDRVIVDSNGVYIREHGKDRVKIDFNDEPPHKKDRK
jgi:hypothetical protein